MFLLMNRGIVQNCCFDLVEELPLLALVDRGAIVDSKMVLQSTSA